MNAFYECFYVTRNGAQCSRINWNIIRDPMSIASYMRIVSLYNRFSQILAFLVLRFTIFCKGQKSKHYEIKMCEPQRELLFPLLLYCKTSFSDTGCFIGVVNEGKKSKVINRRKLLNHFSPHELRQCRIYPHGRVLYRARYKKIVIVFDSLLHFFSYVNYIRHHF